MQKLLVALYILPTTINIKDHQYLQYESRRFHGRGVGGQISSARFENGAEIIMVCLTLTMSTYNGLNDLKTIKNCSYMMEKI